MALDESRLSSKRIDWKASAKEEDVIKVIDNYSIQENSSYGSVLSSYRSEERFKANVDGKNLYYDFLTHLLIISSKGNNKERYELSLFGVLLAMTFIRYHHVGYAYPIASQVVTNSNVLFQES